MIRGRRTRKRTTIIMIMKMKRSKMMQRSTTMIRGRTMRRTIRRSRKTMGYVEEIEEGLYLIRK